ncbi:zinc finger and SCAN domain-containing protein 26-like isoform X2 [Salarias fasciatus]|uniref:zinc finger and SCAN domain-containing protein 26-like isoform X2 n=1 Tax=Salarias fasciatus TaxID=181472 RepID=UPI0011770199|nr:zinc finger and SCAN domain-containing protein 26-like isoform X2 [Salarias fasciatus]
MTPVEALREFIQQRLTAAAGEIFTAFQQTLLHYEKEMNVQDRLLEITGELPVPFSRTELQQHHDCREEQETNYCLEQEEPEPPEIKEEPEEPEPPQIKEEPGEPGPPKIKEEPEHLEFKEEPEEPGLLQSPEDQEEPGPPEIEQHEDLGSRQTGALPVVTFESETLKVPSVEKQSDLSEPEEEPDTEQLLSQDSEVHHENKLIDFPVSEKQAECEETCGEPVRKKPKLRQKVRTVTDKKKTCDTCGKRFSRQSHLLRHMRTHIEMTKTKEQRVCPICGKYLKAVAKHLRQIHRIPNPNERIILNNLATGRILLGGGRCSLPLCNSQVLHLEKHLRGHKDVTDRRVEREIKSLKKATAIRLLAELRASNPTPPLMSTLDVEQEEEEAGGSAAGPGGCTNPSCIQAGQENRELQQEVTELRRDIETSGHSCSSSRGWGLPGNKRPRAGTWSRLEGNTKLFSYAKSSTEI